MTRSFYAHPEGWIVSIYVSEATIFLSVFAVMAGLNITANEEQSGVMDMILSLPISRTAYLVERWIGYALIGLGIVIVSAALTLSSVALLSVETQVDKILASMLNLYPSTLLVMTVTCLLATILRRSRRRNRLGDGICGRQLRVQSHRWRRKRSCCRPHAAVVLLQLCARRRNRARYF